MTEDQKQLAIRQMNLEESTAQINEIMRPRTHTGITIWATRPMGAWQTAFDRLNAVLSGKNEPFSGAAEYLQNVRSGKA